MGAVMGVAVSVAFVGSVDAVEAFAKTHTVTFEETMEQNRSKVVNIPNLKSVSNVKANTGTATATVDGENVTVNVSGGSPSRSVWNPTKHSKTATYSKTGNASAFTVENGGATDNFESASRQLQVSGNWVRTTAKKAGGSYSFTNADINDGQTSQAQMTLVVPANAKTAKVSFKFLVDSETNWDWGNVYLDGTKIVNVSGQMSNWMLFEQELTPGTHTLVFEYAKDSSGSVGTDAFYVDDLSFTYEQLKGADTYSYPTDAQGFAGTLQRQGYAQVSGGSYVPAESKMAQDSRTTAVAGNPASLPATVPYSDGTGFSGTLQKMGDPYVIQGSGPDTQTLEGTLSQNQYTWYKATPEPYPWTNGLYSGTLYPVDVQYNYAPQSVQLEVEYTFYSNNASASELNTLNNAYITNEIVQEFGPNNPDGYYFQNPAVLQATWNEPIQSGSFTTDGTTYPYKRSAKILIAVDGWQYVATIRGDVSKPDDRVWQQDYVGMVKKGGSDTRTWKQDYSGTVYKGDYDHFYAYTVTFDYVDNTAPTGAISSPSDNTKYSGVQNTLRLQGTVKDTDVGDQLKVFYRLNGSNGQAGTLGQTITANGSEQNFAFDVNVGSLVEGTHRIYMWVEDGKGGKSAETYKTFLVDKTAPTGATFTPSTTNPTNQNVSLTINYPTDAKTKQYKIGASGTWTNYTAPISLSANNTVYARSIDEVGNTSAETSFVVNNIDKTPPNAPLLTPSTTSPTNGNVSVTIAYPSDAVVKEYRVNGGSWQTYSSPVSMTANGKVEARAVDQAGNVSTVASLDINNIDKVAPNVPTLTPSTTAKTKDNVNVTINYPSDAHQKLYRINGGSWQAYSSAVVMSANGTVEAVAVDQAGNQSSVGTLSITNIDKVPPADATFTLSTSNPTNQDVTVTIAYPSDAVTKQYKIGASGTWTNYTVPVKLTANNTVYARSYDEVGNVSKETSVVVDNIDKVAPNAPTISLDVTGSTKGDVKVSVAYPSDASVKQYRINGGTWQSYIAPVTVSENSTFEARAIDQAGNVSQVATKSIDNIDKVAPTIALRAITTTPTNKDVLVNVAITENESGIAVKKYATGNQSASYFANGGTALDGTTFTVSENGTYTVYAKDNAGNETVETITISNIDKVAPNPATFTASTTSPTNGKVSVTISYPSDAKTKEFKVGNGEWTAYTTPVEVTENATIYARSVDEAGNVSTVSEFKVENIDKEPPSVELTPSTTDPTNKDVVVSVNIADKDVEVKKYASGNQTSSYFANGGTALSGDSFNVTANGTYTVYVKDKAGNETVKTITISNIDKVAPNPATFEADNTNATNKNVHVTIKYPADAKVKEYKVGNGEWTAYTTPVEVTENTTVYARSVDEAGNVSQVSNFVVGNIDKDAPNIVNLSPSTTNPTNKDVTITAVISDDSGIKVVKYASGNQPASYFANGGNELKGNSFVVSENGTYTVYAKDEAGNETVRTITVSNIDKEAPQNATFSPNTTSATNQNVVLTINYPTDAKVKEYKIGENGTWVAYTSPVQVTSDNTVYARSIDDAGNVSEITSFKVENIDKVAPIVEMTPNRTTPTNEDVVINVTVSDDKSGVAVQKWAKGNQPVSYFANGGTAISGGSFTVTENGTYTVYAKDEAGNQIVEIITISNIDKDAPGKAVFEPSTTSATNGMVSVSILYPNDAKVKEYKVGNGEWNVYTKAVEVTENTTIYARSTDEAGNVSEVSEFAVENIDKDAPTVELSPSTTNPTNKEVVVTASISDKDNDVVVKKYATGNHDAKYFADNGTDLVGDKFTVSENGTYTVYAKDKAGNETVETITISNIDKDAPEKASFKVDKAEITNGNVTVTIEYPADAKVKEYKLGENGEWTAYSSPVEVSENTIVYARSVDEASNVSEVASFKVENIDKEAPSLVLTPNKTEATNTDVVVNVTVSDNDEVAVVKYATGSHEVSHFADNGTVLEGNSFTVSENGTYTVFVMDKAGNMSVEEIVIDNIDKENPDVPTLVADVTTVTNKNVTVTIKYPSDAKVKEYKIGKDGTWTVYDSPVVLTENDEVFARAIDEAGNVSEVASIVVDNIDKDAPDAPTLSVNTEEETNSHVEVTASFPQDAVVQQYKVGENGEWKEYNAPIVVEDNETVFVRGQDEAGNWSDVASIVIDNIDKVAPNNPVFAVDVTEPTNDVVTVSVTFSDDSVVKQYKVGNSGEWFSYEEPIVVSENTTVYARAYDKAGNVTEAVSINIDNIDKVAPSVSTISHDGSVNEITITSGSDKESGVKEVQYQVDGEEWEVYSEAIVLPDGEYVIRAKTIDNAGNESEVVSETVVLYQEALATATSSVEKAEQTLETVDLDRAKELVNSLPESAEEKEELYNRILSAEALKYAEDALELAVNDLTLDNIVKAKDLISKLPEGELKTQLEEKIKKLEDYYNLLMNATSMVEKAEKAQKDGKVSEAVKAVESARALVSQLVEDDAKPLSDRLDEVQKYIDNHQLIADAQNAVAKAQQTKQQADIDSAKELVNKLEDGALKRSLENQLYLLQQEVNKDLAEQEAIARAESAVEKAEQTKLQSDIDEAKALVNALTNSPKKSELLNRLNAIQSEISDGEQDTVLTPEEIANLEAKAKEAVTWAESLKTEDAIEKALDLVELLPEGSLKDELMNRLNKVISDLEALDENIMNAIELVEQAEETLNPDHLKEAREAVKKLPNNQLRFDLDDRLDLVQYKIDLAKIEQDTELLKKANSDIRMAELFKRNPYIAKAEISIGMLPDYMPEKPELEQRLDAVKKEFEAKEYQKLLNNAESKVKTAERLKTIPSIISAIEAVYALPEGADKDRLMDRLNAISDGMTIEELVTSKALELAIKYVERAEANPTAFRIKIAEYRVNKLADSIPQKAQLHERLDVAEQVYFEKMANRYVSYAEKYNSVYFHDRAESFISRLEDQVKQAELRDRLQVVAEQIAQYRYDQAKQALERAVATPTMYYINYAKGKIGELKDDVADKQAFMDRIHEVERNFFISEAEKAVADWEKNKSQFYFDRAVNAVDRLEDGELKQSLLVRLGLATAPTPDETETPDEEENPVEEETETDEPSQEEPEPTEDVGTEEPNEETSN